jgi:hypothetical protein
MFSYSLATSARDAGYVVATERFVCLVGAGAAPESVTRLYTALRSTEATLPDVLDVFSALPDIVNAAVAELVDARDRVVHLAVRGGIEVELDQASTTRLGAVGESAWMTTQVRGVSALRLSITAGAARGPALPLRNGVAMASSASLTTSPAEQRPVEQPVAVAEPSLSTMPIMIPRVADLMGEPYRASASPRATRVALPSRWFIVLADGSDVEVRQPVIVGRRPWHGQTESVEVVHIVAPSPRREISSAHVEFSIENGELVCRDLHSTNGTVVRSGGRPPWLLERGSSATLAGGDILDLGESFIIRVESRS